MGIKKNTRVRIRNPYAYHGRFHGMIGTVAANYRDYYETNSVAVCIDGIPNPKSKYKAFWFNIQDLEPIKDLDAAMLPGEYKTVMCRTPESKTTFPAACFDLDVKPDDMVIIQGCYAKTVEIVVEVIDDAQPVNDHRELITVIDSNAVNRYQARIKQRQLERELACKKHELENRMRDIAETIDQNQIYLLVAKNDPDMAAMLAEYESLTL